MVHVRFNEKESNPNPHINFITALPINDAAAEEDARQLLRALAAQVKPIMKAHGFVINSFEEYEYNRVFAGRNWESGEVVELVLRGSNDAFLPTSWLMSTLCHELAHIRHMNHGPDFQALWAQLRREVRDLQAKGYYGDGYWSSGTRLVDAARVGGEGIVSSELPEYLCGGAQKRTRPSNLRRRRKRRSVGPSNHTGAQTAKKRKAGSRITTKDAFVGNGRTLDEDIGDEEQKKAGAGFRKKATSKRAREERALAVERRLMALTQQPGPSTLAKEDGDAGSDGEEGDLETDCDRRRILLESIPEDDLTSLKSSFSDFENDFVLPSASGTYAQAGSSQTQDTKVSIGQTGRVAGDQLSIVDIDSPPKKKQKLAYGSLIMDEVKHRKKEALGMTGTRRKLGKTTSATLDSSLFASRQSKLLDLVTKSEGKAEKTPMLSSRNNKVPSAWSCLVCTLSNEPGHLACSACGTAIGESTWDESSL